MNSLRPYQNEAVEFAFGKNALLALPMGAGKTACALHAIPNDDNLLIVCPVASLNVWADELDVWQTGRKAVLYRGSPKRRETLRAEIKAGKHKTIITNYEMLSEIAQHKLKGFEHVVFDESHRLRNRKTNRYKAAQNLLRATKPRPHVIMLSGTPVVAHPADIIPQLMLLTDARSYWKIVEEYFNVNIGPYGWEIEGIKDPKIFGEYIAETIMHRDRKEVLPGMPEKVRRNIHIDMTASQRKIYKEIISKLYIECDNGEVILTPTVLSQITRLRQLLITPQLLGIDERGSALTYLKDFLADVRDVNERIVIFTPFAKAITHIQSVANSAGLTASNIHGGLSKTERDKTIQRFQAGNTNCIISTVQIAEGFSLNTANRALFVGCDWNASVNEQAEDRVYRPGITKPVLMEYLVHTNSIEQHVLEIVGLKKWHEQNMFSLPINAFFPEENK